MANILDGLGLEGSVIDGLAEWPVSTTRKRVTASEKKTRHEWAVRQIDAGMGLSELTAFTAETWGC